METTEQNNWTYEKDIFLVDNIFKNHQSLCLCAVCSLSHVWLFATPRTIACQALLSMGFPRQEYWSELHYFLQGIFPRVQPRFQDLSDPGVSCIGRCILYHWASWEALPVCICNQYIFLSDICINLCFKQTKTYYSESSLQPNSIILVSF